jgi:hypothetical protein
MDRNSYSPSDASLAVSVEKSTANSFSSGVLFALALSSFLIIASYIALQFANNYSLNLPLVLGESATVVLLLSVLVSIFSVPIAAIKLFKYPNLRVPKNIILLLVSSLVLIAIGVLLTTDVVSFE